MKNAFYVLLLGGLIASCKSGNKNPVADSTSKITTSVDQGNKLIEKFAPLIQGVWVKEAYISSIGKTGSPYRSFKQLRGVASLFINVKNIKDDSLVIGYSLNNHEGAQFPLYFKRGKQSNSLLTGLPDYDLKSNSNELGYVINGRDTTLIFYHYNKNKNLIDSTIYSRVANNASAEDDAGKGIELITNKILISGNYNLTDINGTISKVSFNNNGSISGFLNFKNYYVATDFEAGPENNLDQIYFDLYEKSQKQYLFKLKPYTIE